MDTLYNDIELQALLPFLEAIDVLILSLTSKSNYIKWQSDKCWKPLLKRKFRKKYNMITRTPDILRNVHKNQSYYSIYMKQVLELGYYKDPGYKGELKEEDWTRPRDTWKIKCHIKLCNHFMYSDDVDDRYTDNTCLKCRKSACDNHRAHVPQYLYETETGERKSGYVDLDYIICSICYGRYYEGKIDTKKIKLLNEDRIKYLKEDRINMINDKMTYYKSLHKCANDTCLRNIRLMLECFYKIV